MRKREKITQNELTDDLITAVKHPPSQSKESYTKSDIKSTVICILFALLAVIASYLWLWTEAFLIVLFAVALAVGVFLSFLARRRTEHTVRSVRAEQRITGSRALPFRSETRRAISTDTEGVTANGCRYTPFILTTVRA